LWKVSQLFNTSFEEHKMPGVVTRPQTLYDKVFNDHIVDEKDDGTILLYIGMYYLSAIRGAKRMSANTSPDRHLVHEVTSPV
jgi:3-isopropylmalate dehydratase